MSKTFPRSQGRGEIVASEVPPEHFYGIYWSRPGSAARVYRSNSPQPHLGRGRQCSPGLRTHSAAYGGSSDGTQLVPFRPVS